ncbi:hypothetical protein CDAR_198531 [Caerostris darwini]|uniref:Uncharacterized protein n=1 Tax=Caerostris darwini TaxID=1538125 RepID=A0AAV4W374_9ARAC|nr:hypothetical protein CDAR_198531 [Caerostris darwini]
MHKNYNKPRLGGSRIDNVCCREGGANRPPPRMLHLPRLLPIHGQRPLFTSNEVFASPDRLICRPCGGLHLGSAAFDGDPSRRTDPFSGLRGPRISPGEETLKFARLRSRLGFRSHNDIDLLQIAIVDPNPSPSCVGVRIGRPPNGPFAPENHSHGQKGTSNDPIRSRELHIPNSGDRVLQKISEFFIRTNVFMTARYPVSMCQG